MLLGLGQLYEALRVGGAARARGNSPAAGSWLCSALSAEHVRRPDDKPLPVVWWGPLKQYRAWTAYTTEIRYGVYPSRQCAIPLNRLTSAVTFKGYEDFGRQSISTKSLIYLGWLMGLEPTTTGITILDSTN